jgi:nonsense-mediated mRNA decay protein 3
MLICPKCGSSSDKKEFFEAFCIDCYPFNIRLPKDLQLDLCKRCGQMKLKGEWQAYNRRKVEEWVASRCRGGFESCVYSLDERSSSRARERSSRDLGSRVLSFQFRNGDRKKTIIRNWELKTVDTTCQNCSRISGGYFEAILQLRGDTDKVERKAQKLGTELGRKTFISKWEEMHGGLNLYVGSTRVVFEILQKLGLKPSKISKKLTGRREGKKMYRTTFAVRV